MTVRDPYLEWDAAYLLGALSPSERREFEDHLVECARCRDAVAELAGVPATLRLLDAEQAAALVVSEPRDEAHSAAPAGLLGGVEHRIRRRRRRRLAGAALGVAAVAVLATVLVVPILAPSASAVDLQLQPVASEPLRASVSLKSEQWGTRIDMRCDYDDDGDSAADRDHDGDGAPSGETRGHRYSMWVTDAQGRAVEVATWVVLPGTTAEPTATTTLTPREIALVDVRAEPSGAVLLRGKP